MKVVVVGFVFLVLGSVSGFLSHAAPLQKHPCKSEMHQFCRFEEEQDQEHLDVCLKKYENKLSSGCKTYLPTLLKKLQNYQFACAEDLKKHCPELSFKNWFKAFGCLNSNEAELSEECKLHIHPQHPVWESMPQEQLRDDL